MKSTGIVRKVDELGRVVIPIELRNSMNISHRDPLEIYTDGDSIILKKNEISCTFCGNEAGIVDFKHKFICRKCIGELCK